MEIINISNDFKKTIKDSSIALGNFDGLHLGHYELIKEVLKNDNLVASVLLFDKHTKDLIFNEERTIITDLEQKIEILKNLGIKRIYLLDFDDKIMKLSPSEFFNEILIDKIGAKKIVVGYDYKFGYKAKGNSNSLIKMGKNYDVEIKIIPAKKNKNRIIKSSYIRELLREGMVDRAEELMSRPYQIKGIVVDGFKRGRTLGFPTANIELLSNYVIPKEGVYKTEVIIENNKYNGATSIGENPTFKDEGLKIETHIIGFQGEIYDEKIKINFKKYLRENIKFSNSKDLISQINEDIIKIIK